MIKKIPENTEYYRYFNINPKDRRASDCVVRAIAKATGQTWQKVYTDLCELGLKYGYMPNDDECFAKYLTKLGWVKKKEPRDAFNRKYSVKDWIDIQLASEYGLDTEIIATVGSHHLTAIIDCKVVDIWDCSYETMHTYWVREY